MAAILESVEALTDPVPLTIEYREGEDGFVIAQIREFPAAISQGRTRDEARTSVLDALRELVLSYLEEPVPAGSGESSEAVSVVATR